MTVRSRSLVMLYGQLGGEVGRTCHGCSLRPVQGPSDGLQATGQDRATSERIRWMLLWTGNRPEREHCSRVLLQRCGDLADDVALEAADDLCLAFVRMLEERDRVTDHVQDLARTGDSLDDRRCPRTPGDARGRK